MPALYDCRKSANVPIREVIVIVGAAIAGIFIVALLLQTIAEPPKDN